MLGRQFFKVGKGQLARSYFENAFAAAPDDAVVCLLLAVARADEGDAESAQGLLTKAERLGGASPFAIHYARGRLYAHAARWREALAAFKRALSVRAAPEAHYLVALAALQVGYLKLAAQHANRALALDQKYAEAHVLLGLIMHASGATTEARAAFAQARALAKQAQAKELGAQRAARFTGESLLRSFFGVGAERARLLTGGDARLAGLLRVQALGG